MGKEFFAERARFYFTPPFVIKTEEEFDLLTGIINDTIQCEVGGAASFYFFLPDPESENGSFILTIYRNDYVKQNPKLFGLKKKQLKDLEGTLPDDFAHLMFILFYKISDGLSKEQVESTYDLISIDEEGNEYIQANAECTQRPEEEGDDDDDDSDEGGRDPKISDFPDYESYSTGDGDDDEDSNI